MGEGRLRFDGCFHNTHTHTPLHAPLQVALVNDGPVTLVLDSETVGPRKGN